MKWINSLINWLGSKLNFKKFINVSTKKITNAKNTVNNYNQTNITYNITFTYNLS